MAPIHDTDLAEERWSKAEWESYELWEKIELRLRRRKMLVIAAAVALFLLLSSVPIVMDQLPRWKAITISRRMAQELNRMKKDASLQHQAFRIRFTAPESLSYVIEKAARCSAPTGWSAVREGSFALKGSPGDFSLLEPQRGTSLGIPGLLSTYCYDHLSGSDYGDVVGKASSMQALSAGPSAATATTAATGASAAPAASAPSPTANTPIPSTATPDTVAGFAVLYGKDLTEHQRMDRISILLLKGPTGDMSFE